MSNQNLYTLNILKSFVSQDYKVYADKVIQLYKDRRIENFRSAENLIKSI